AIDDSFPIAVPVGRPDPQNLPAKPFQHLLPRYVGGARCLSTMIGRAITLNTCEEPARFVGVLDTDVNSISADSNLRMNVPSSFGEVSCHFLFKRGLVHIDCRSR